MVFINTYYKIQIIVVINLPEFIQYLVDFHIYITIYIQ
jgi:hypothetical protein